MDVRSQVRARAAGIGRRVRALSPRDRLLAAVWLGFVILVAAGVHGSSNGASAFPWMPEKPYTGTLLRSMPIPAFVKSNVRKDKIQNALLEVPREIRWDEVYGGTPFALSQLSHKPRFPVINTNIGADGQNMLVTQHAPVWHLASLGRPATWGYFFLGAQRGLAWSWWFQNFACFTALTLLLEIVLRGQWKLAAFGAFLFCSSAYVICWSQWPAYTTMFGAVACLSAYHLLASRRRGVLVASAILFGMAAAGFATDLYPPWQVPVGEVFGGLFVALVARDRLLANVTSGAEPKRARLLAMTGAVLFAGVILFAWWHACRADLAVMAHTSYPGRRVSTGGDLTFASLFRGTYNLWTIFDRYKPLKNESEASSFYFFFPAVFALLCLSPAVRRRFGAVGWFLVGYIVVVLFFLLKGMPEALARVLFLSYTPARSADIGLGIASTILTVHTLAVIRQVRDGGDAVMGGARRFVAPAVAAVVLVLFLLHAHAHHRLVGKVPNNASGFLMPVIMAALSWALVSGRRRVFAAPLAVLQVVTVFWFNPLATNLDNIYDSELAHAISDVKAHAGGRSTWVVYGGTHVGALVEVLGDRAITGIQWPPQIHAWSALDPTGKDFAKYNRYAEIIFYEPPDPNTLSLQNPMEAVLIVKVSPDNPVLKKLDVRYVLLIDKQQKAFDPKKLHLVRKGANGHFSIYEVL